MALLEKSFSGHEKSVVFVYYLAAVGRRLSSIEVYSSTWPRRRRRVAARRAVDFGKLLKPVFLPVHETKS